MKVRVPKRAKHAKRTKREQMHPAQGTGGKPAAATVPQLEQGQGGFGQAWHVVESLRDLQYSYCCDSSQGLACGYKRPASEVLGGPVVEG
jgi:hypothetical protein